MDYGQVKVAVMTGASQGITTGDCHFSFLAGT